LICKEITRNYYRISISDLRSNTHLSMHKNYTDDVFGSEFDTNFIFMNVNFETKLIYGKK